MFTLLSVSVSLPVWCMHACRFMLPVMLGGQWRVSDILLCDSLESGSLTGLELGWWPASLSDPLALSLAQQLLFLDEPFSRAIPIPITTNEF